MPPLPTRSFEEPMRLFPLLIVAAQQPLAALPHVTRTGIASPARRIDDIVAVKEKRDAVAADLVVAGGTNEAVRAGKSRRACRSCRYSTSPRRHRCRNWT